MVGNKHQETGEQREKGAEKQEEIDIVTPPPADWHPTPPTAYHLLSATLVVVASIAGRVSNLDAFSLSNDEGAYLMWAWLVHSGHPLYSETVSVSAPFLVVALDWAYDLAGVSLVTGRVLVLGFWGLALFSLIWSGRLLHHWLSGVMAGIAFSLAPLAFVLSRMAIGEIPSLALATLSLAWALSYWRGGKQVWLALSGLVLSLSLLTKTMNPLLVLPILWLIVAHHQRNRADWSKVAISLAVWGLAVLLPVFVCLLIYEPRAFYDQAVAFRLELREVRPWSLAHNVASLEDFFRQHWGIVGLALVGAVLLVQKAIWDTLFPLGLWLVGSLLTVLFHSPLFPHHTIILLPPLALLAGTSITETVTLLPERRWSWGALGLVGGLAFLAALPGAIQANQKTLAASFGREAEAIAFLQEITPSNHYVISDNLLLPFMAGRRTPPPLGDVAQVAIDSGRQTSERLMAISEAYPIASVANWALRLPHLDEYMDWVEDNYLVQRVWDDHHIVYFGRRLGEDQVPNRVDAQVGDSIDLLGYDVQSSDPRGTQGRPETLDVLLYWRASSLVEKNFTVFVQLLDSEGQLIAQHDGQPLYGYLPTSAWSPNEVTPDRHQLPLPADLSPGGYQLIAGMYTLETLERLPVRTAHPQDAEDSVELAVLTISDQGLEK
jgi:hypothetical protein